jgi:DNA polymerase epsilon subunit 2
VDFLGTGSLTLTEEAKLRISEKAHPESFLFFSDMYLDSPKHLLNFRKVLQAYEGFEGGQPPALCVLCGNFSSKAVNVTDGKSLREYQGELFQPFDRGI